MLWHSSPKAGTGTPRRGRQNSLCPESSSFWLRSSSKQFSYLVLQKIRNKNEGMYIAQANVLMAVRRQLFLRKAESVGPQRQTETVTTTQNKNCRRDWLIYFLIQQLPDETLKTTTTTNFIFLITGLDIVKYPVSFLFPFRYFLMWSWVEISCLIIEKQVIASFMFLVLS